MTVRTFHFLIALLSLQALAQTPLLTVGIQMNGGRLYSSSEIVDPNPYALYRKDLFSLAEAGLFAEKRIKTIGISLSSGYSYQRMRFQDPNAEYFSSGEQQLFYTTTSSSVYSSLGIAKYLEFNTRISGYGKLAFRAQFGSSTAASATGSMQTIIGDVPVTTTLSNESFTMGLCPELGIQIRKNNHAWTFFVQQNAGLTDASKGESTRDILGSTVDQSEFSSKGSYTSLGVRYSFNINKKEKTEHLVAKEKKVKEPKPKRTKDSTKTDDKKITYNENGLPATLDERPIEKQNEVVVRSTEIEFFVWDDKQEDKDSISLYINGQWVLQNFEITKKKKSVKVTIDPQRDNYLIMYALNEGKFPPNTCAISIDDGTGEKRLYLKSSMKSCGALQFRYKPKE